MIRIILIPLAILLIIPCIIIWALLGDKAGFGREY